MAIVCVSTSKARGSSYKSDDATIRANKLGKHSGVAAEVGSHIDCGVSRLDEFGQHRQLGLKSAGEQVKQARDTANVGGDNDTRGKG